MTATPQFIPGDRVRIRGTERTMKVLAITPKGISCAWSQHAEAGFGIFSPDTLELVARPVSFSTP